MKIRRQYSIAIAHCIAAASLSRCWMVLCMFMHVLSGHQQPLQQPVCQDAEECRLVHNITWKALCRGKVQRKLVTDKSEHRQAIFVVKITDILHIFWSGHQAFDLRIGNVRGHAYQGNRVASGNRHETDQRRVHDQVQDHCHSRRRRWHLLRLPGHLAGTGWVRRVKKRHAPCSV